MNAHAKTERSAPDSHPAEPTRRQRALAWSVHCYTATGIPLAVGGALALVVGDAALFFVLNWIAIGVDATDGMLARRFRVKEVLPDFSGEKLDDLVDFLTFAFLPALALPTLDILPEDLAWLAVLPVMASSYGFSQVQAKTADAFVGFPSYWNLLVFYLYTLTSPIWVTVTLLVVFSVLVFIPTYYIYPTRTQLLRRVTLTLGGIYGATLVLISSHLDAPWVTSAVWGSMSYVVYYFTLSAIHHRRITDRNADHIRPT